jgi:hypothetical protein
MGKHRQMGERVDASSSADFPQLQDGMGRAHNTLTATSRLLQLQTKSGPI